MEKVIVIRDISKQLDDPFHHLFTKTYMFTSRKLADKFIIDWNKSQKEDCIKNTVEENVYFGSKEWVYFLEIKEVETNQPINRNGITLQGSKNET